MYIFLHFTPNENFCSLKIEKPPAVQLCEYYALYFRLHIAGISIHCSRTNSLKENWIFLRKETLFLILIRFSFKSNRKALKLSKKLLRVKKALRTKWFKNFNYYRKWQQRIGIHLSLKVLQFYIKTWIIYVSS